MPDPLRIYIRSDWDATLTYDSLYDEPKGRRPVFVGREVLIAPLVAEIAEPNKRGTYLISGYRGTGKTTLLIEALSRAKQQLAGQHIKLFPLVLNVSEVSASLGNSTSEAEIKLNIDPRRLLIALIRTIRDGIGRLKADEIRDGIDRPPSPPMLTQESLAELVETVDNVYQKAIAAKYSRLGKTAQEDIRTRSWELALALEDKHALKTLAVITGAGAAAFEAAAFIGPSWGWLHAGAAALAAVFAVSLAASFKLGRSKKQTDTRETSLEYDNSLQQLETDLKDILASLKDKGLRTVVVMEELDKIDDRDGQQLAAVIRYFKNLFTQAPALFFFVTDKSYFDIVASAIKRARRERSYAVEHTFFTHRIFVGRPTTEESLEFIAAIVANDGDRRKIKAVAQTLGKPSRIDETDQLGRFVRYVLFNAANHLFDLKNELRRFARNEEHEINGDKVRLSSFLIDDQTLPPEQAALAVFQDLIVEKSRSFEIKGGRTYANETLADSLYALFNELGSNQPQKIDSFLPISNGHSTDALLLDEQLDLSEAARVREAVNSLIGDLERGRAFKTRDTAAFTWRDDAARAFRYVRQLQKHEEELIAELQRNAARIDSLSDNASRHPTSLKFENRVNELRSLPEPLPADAAAAEQRAVIDDYAVVLSETYAARIKDLSEYGFQFEEVAKGVGGILYFVKPKLGDPRLRASAPRGGVLLAFGNTETLDADIYSFIRPTAKSLSPLDRAALVHVVHEDSDVNWSERWKNYLARQSEPLPDFLYVDDVVPLVRPDKDSELNEVQRIAATLAGFGAWARAENRPYDWIASDTGPLIQALEKWKTLDAPVFHISIPTKSAFRAFEERDVLEQDGQVVLRLMPDGEISIAAEIGKACLMLGFDEARGGAERWEPLGNWLLKERRIYLFINWEEDYERWALKDLRKAIELGARLIIVKHGDLPPGIEAITAEPTAPPPAEQTKSEKP